MCSTGTAAPAAAAPAAAAPAFHSPPPAAETPTNPSSRSTGGVAPLAGPADDWDERPTGEVVKTLQNRQDFNAIATAIVDSIDPELLADQISHRVAEASPAGRQDLTGPPRPVSQHDRLLPPSSGKSNRAPARNLDMLVAAANRAELLTSAAGLPPIPGTQQFDENTRRLQARGDDDGSGSAAVNAGLEEGSGSAAASAMLNAAPGSESAAGIGAPSNRESAQDMLEARQWLSRRPPHNLLDEAALMHNLADGNSVGGGSNGDGEDVEGLGQGEEDERDERLGQEEGERGTDEEDENLLEEAGILLDRGDEEKNDGVSVASNLFVCRCSLKPNQLLSNTNRTTRWPASTTRPPSDLPLLIQGETSTTTVGLICLFSWNDTRSVWKISAKPWPSIQPMLPDTSAWAWRFKNSTETPKH